MAAAYKELATELAHTGQSGCKNDMMKTLSLRWIALFRRRLATSMESEATQRSNTSLTEKLISILESAPRKPLELGWCRNSKRSETFKSKRSYDRSETLT